MINNEKLHYLFDLSECEEEKEIQMSKKQTLDFFRGFLMATLELIGEIDEEREVLIDLSIDDDRFVCAFSYVDSVEWTKDYVEVHGAPMEVVSHEDKRHEDSFSYLYTDIDKIKKEIVLMVEQLNELEIL